MLVQAVTCVTWAPQSYPNLPHQPTNHQALVTPWALLSGALWTFAIIGRIAAIHLLGLCSATVAAESATALTAFSCSLLWAHPHVSCGWLAVGGAALLAAVLVQMGVFDACRLHTRGVGGDEDDENDEEGAARPRLEAGAGAAADAIEDAGMGALLLQPAAARHQGHGSADGSSLLSLLLGVRRWLGSDPAAGLAWACFSGACIGARGVFSPRLMFCPAHLCEGRRPRTTKNDASSSAARRPHPLACCDGPCRKQRPKLHPPKRFG